MEKLIQETLQPVLISVITAVISAVGGYIVYWLRKKTGIEVSRAFEESVQRAARQAVLAVEERAMAELAAGAAKWAGSTKLGAAIDMVVRQVPGITQEQADTAIHAVIADIPGLGKSGNVYAAPKQDQPK